LPKHRILIADDDKELAVILEDELTFSGFDVQVADNGENSIALLQQNHFDAAILDIRMPKIDGFGVLKFIKDRFPAMKVIMLTGFADLTNSVKSKEFGADEFMEKPYNLEVIRHTLDTLLAQ